MPNVKIASILLCGLVLGGQACSHQSDVALNSDNQGSLISSQLIKLNQIGYLPNAEKIAVVPDVAASTFTVVNITDKSVAYSGELSSAKNWKPADEAVKTADFTSLTGVGNYRIEVKGVAVSHSFQIAENVFLAVHDAALKAYYYNRASTELLAEHAGVYAREAGHTDTNVMVHRSAASAARPEGTIISSPKGWYDAGDYGKYIVNSGITTYTLLAAYEHFSDFYQNRDLRIPESSDDIPDILNEIKWNLDWMLSMQDPADGGVYHKLTTLRFSGTPMPKDATEQRYVVQKGTAATLNFSAVMAVASRVFANYSKQFPDLADTYKQAAISSWQWAQQHNNLPYTQPIDVATGGYGDASFDDEFSWAAAELYLLTAGSEYLQVVTDIGISAQVPSWSDSSALGLISLMANGQSLLPEADYQIVSAKIFALADKIVAVDQQSAYRVAMQNEDFVWGSNAVVMNKAMVLLQAFRNTGNIKYKNAAQGLTDYVLGKNPTDYSYVTGFGHKTPMDIHHRASKADDVVKPIPGFVAGGAQPGQQDSCDYPSKLAAKSYVDDYCSYSANEIAINWNAPLVYVLAGLQAL